MPTAGAVSSATISMTLLEAAGHVMHSATTCRAPHPHDARPQSPDTPSGDGWEVIADPLPAQRRPEALWSDVLPY
jgi:hypothetical protein